MALRGIALENLTQKQKEPSALDKISQGLNMAQSIIGSVGGVSDLLSKIDARKMAELKATELKQNEEDRYLTPKEELDAESKMVKTSVPKKTPGAYKTQGGYATFARPPKEESAIDKLTKSLDAQLKANKLSEVKLTPGQEAVDKKIAGDYVEYVQTGRVENQANLETLDKISEELEAQKGDFIPPTGKMFGALSKVGLEKTLMQKSANKKSIVDAIVIKNLKNVFPGNPTEGERESLLKASYDPQLTPEQNKAKLLDLSNRLKLGMAAKEALYQEYEQKGTIKDYKGPKSNSDFMKAMGLKEVPKQAVDPKLLEKHKDATDDEIDAAIAKKLKESKKP